MNDKLTRKIFLVLAILATSCSFQSDDEQLQGSSNGQSTGSNRLVIAPAIVDSDGDGIEDRFDPTPSVARIPHIGIHRVEFLRFLARTDKSNDETTVLENKPIRRGTRHSFLDERSNFLVHEIRKLHLEKLRNPLFTPSREETISHEDMYLSPISSWTWGQADIFKSTTGRLRPDDVLAGRARFYLHFDNLADTTEINDVLYEIVDTQGIGQNSDRLAVTDAGGFGSTFNFSGERDLFSTQPVEYLSLRQSVSNLNKITNENAKVSVRIIDFNYTLMGKTFKFSEQIGSIKSKTSLIVYLDEEDKISYGFIAAGNSLLESFKQINTTVEADEHGRILSVDGRRNAVPSPVDFDLTPPSDPYSYSVQLIGARSLNEIARAGETYIISNSMAMSLSASIRKNKGEEFSTESKEIFIGEFFPNEKVEIKIEGERSDYRTVARTENVKRSWMDVGGDCRGRGIGGGIGPLSEFSQEKCFARVWRDVPTEIYYATESKRENIFSRSLNDFLENEVSVDGYEQSLSYIMKSNETVITQNGKTAYMHFQIPDDERGKVKVYLYSKNLEPQKLRLGLIEDSTCPGRDCRYEPQGNHVPRIETFQNKQKLKITTKRY